MSKIKHVLIGVLIFCMAGYCGNAYAQQPYTKTVRVLGSGTMKDNNTVAAKEQAISDSLVSAVARVAMDSLPIKPLIQNFNEFNDILHGHSGEFIRNNFIQEYKVLTETQHGNLYIVMVETTVLVDNLQKHLSEAGVIIGKVSIPRILFLISEQNITASSPTYWWDGYNYQAQSMAEKTMALIMSKKGFVIIEDRRLPKIFDKKSLSPDIDDASALKIANELTADFVIVGKSFSNQVPNTMGSNINSFRGTVSVRALRTKTGNGVETATETYITVDNDAYAGGFKSISGAGALAARAIMPKILSVWHEEKQESILLEVTVKGTDYLSNFVRFRKVINELPGVSNVQTKVMTSDEAVITVEFTGNAKAFAETLMLKTFGSFGINITDITQNSLHIVLVQK